MNNTNNNFDLFWSMPESVGVPPINSYNLLNHSTDLMFVDSLELSVSSGAAVYPDSFQSISWTNVMEYSKVFETDSTLSNNLLMGIPSSYDQTNIHVINKTFLNSTHEIISDNKGVTSGFSGTNVIIIVALNLVFIGALYFLYTQLNAVNQEYIVYFSQRVVNSIGDNLGEAIVNVGISMICKKIKI